MLNFVLLLLYIFKKNATNYECSVSRLYEVFQHNHYNNTCDTHCVNDHKLLIDAEEVAWAAFFAN